MTYIFYNPLSNNKKGKQDLVKITDLLKTEDVSIFDITKELRTKSLIFNATKDDTVVITGGDGTLHKFANSLYEDGTNPDQIKAKLFYYPSGSGNDFMHDVGKMTQKKLIDLLPYLRKLPTVTIDSKTFRFINGVGVGLDGFCCDVAEKKRQNSNKSINYTAIAIKGLFGFFNPLEITTVVDGIPHSYKNVWLAPAMNGRYFGGGMRVAPKQHRLNEQRILTFVVAHSMNRLRALTVFPEFPSGKYIRHKKFVDLKVCKEITVTFSRPVPIEVDGEAISNVTSYSIKTEN